MSKRMRLSLLSTPTSSLPALQQCSALIPITARGNTRPPPLLLLQNGEPLRRRDQLLQQQQQQKQHRPFSTTPSRPVGIQRMATAGTKNQPSMSIQLATQQANAMRDGVMLNYLGLLDNTFVPPSGKNLPSYFTDYRTRWKLQRYRFKSLLDELRGNLAAYWFVKPRADLEKRKVPGIAQELYEEMCSRFAAGTISQMESKLAPGILGNLKHRLSGRKANTALKWTLCEYYGKPKLVSYKFNVFPDKDAVKNNKMGIAQAVVRIKSKQSLQHVQRVALRDGPPGKATVKDVVVDESGKPVPEDMLEEHQERNTKVTTEFLVVQKLMKKSTFGPWHIWGTAEESTVETMKKQEEALMKKLKAQQKMKG